MPGELIGQKKNFTGGTFCSFLMKEGFRAVLTLTAEVQTI